MNRFRVIKNTTKKDISVTVNGTDYFFKPNEEKVLPEDIAKLCEFSASDKKNSLDIAVYNLKMLDSTEISKDLLSKMAGGKGSNTIVKNLRDKEVSIQWDGVVYDFPEKGKPGYLKAVPAEIAKVLRAQSLSMFGYYAIDYAAKEDLCEGEKEEEVKEVKKRK